MARYPRWRRRRSSSATTSSASADAGRRRGRRRQHRAGHAQRLRRLVHDLRTARRGGRGQRARCDRSRPATRGARHSAEGRAAVRRARRPRGGARVALVSETAARRFWPGENPVGKQIRAPRQRRARRPRDRRRRRRRAHARTGARSGSGRLRPAHAVRSREHDDRGADGRRSDAGGAADHERC